METIGGGVEPVIEGDRSLLQPFVEAVAVGELMGEAAKFEFFQEGQFFTHLSAISRISSAVSVLRDSAISSTALLLRWC